MTKKSVHQYMHIYCNCAKSCTSCVWVHACLTVPGRLLFTKSINAVNCSTESYSMIHHTFIWRHFFQFPHFKILTRFVSFTHYFWKGSKKWSSWNETYWACKCSFLASIARTIICIDQQIHPTFSFQQFLTRTNNGEDRSRSRNRRSWCCSE